jgi:cytoskeleton protein RodZ
MGQEIRGKPEAAALSADPERSIGAYLARQRELRGISLDELATLTRIPRRSLERLESGVFDRAPDGFVRGFVRTVAAALGLDPDETVMRLLAEPAAEGLDARGEVAGWGTPAARALLLAFAGLLAVGALGWLATSLRARPDAPRDDGVVLRPDPIRELAREAAARSSGAGAGIPAAEPAPTPGEPAEPAAPLAGAGAQTEAATGAAPELAPPADLPATPPAAAPPAAPDASAAP